MRPSLHHEAIPSVEVRVRQVTLLVALAHQEESIEGDALLVLQFLKQNQSDADARTIARSGRGLRTAGINRVRAASAALVAKSLITETKPDTWTLTPV